MKYTVKNRHEVAERTYLCSECTRKIPDGGTYALVKAEFSNGSTYMKAICEDCISNEFIEVELDTNKFILQLQT